MDTGIPEAEEPFEILARLHGPPSYSQALYNGLQQFALVNPVGSGVFEAGGFELPQVFGQGDH
jgi:hypothetical protein